MASGWVWQGTSEAPTHCVFHYPSAPPVPVPPPPCFPYASSENRYSFSASYGFASVAPSYPMFSTQCVRVTFVSKPRVLCEQSQADESSATTKFVAPAEPTGLGTGSLSASGTGPGSLSSGPPGPAPCPSRPPASEQTVILVPSSASASMPAIKLPEREHHKGDGKHCYTYAKRRCRPRPRPRQSQEILAEETVRVPQALPGVGQCGVQECVVPARWVVLTRPRRVTKRVGGVKTPHPYQRRRKSLIQRHLLQIPGDRQLCKTLNLKTRQHHYAILAADYEEDVMTYLLEVERRHQRRYNYLTAHPSVSQRTRAILVDWLIQVQSYLGVSCETLYQSVVLMDRVLEACSIPVPCVQLLAVTCLLIASKLEEQQPVETSELLHLTLNSYSHGELLAMERRVLQVLRFRLTYAEPTVFLGYFLHLTCNTHDQTITDCCDFLMEVVLVESWPLETRPSLLAAAALHGALMIIHGALAASAVPLLMPKYFSLAEEAIVATSLRLLEALSNRFHLPFQGAENKYASQSRHHALARHPRLQPVYLLTVVDKVRATLIYLRGENTVIRSSQHTPAEGPAALYQQHAVPLPGGDGLRHLDAAVTGEQVLVGRE
ncbi:uncharacterized protein LOC127003364 isoform X2 [Eriocheir sinensis]|uniref:uncharacterized protein LOC127003364 isoform X2 n=1 Tax=Eriocheir sinensis TaxID=95602 RepID=UPI0021CA2EDD|nr:uncharacterized protein LOC127003364 isoform X2 [Eriocheir sinensis]